MNLKRPLRKMAIGAAVTAATLALTGSSAFAFECYNASRSAQGNASAAKSPALASFAEILGDPGFIGLCPDGVEFVLAELEDLGYDTSLLINSRTLMAGGLEKNGKGGELLHNGKGIDHLSEAFIEDVDPLIGQAFAICS